MESIATEPRTTPGGLIVPDSCWTDECALRSPYARAFAGAFPEFTACTVVDWYGAGCDIMERKTIAQRTRPHDGPPLRFLVRRHPLMGGGEHWVDELGWPL